MKKLGGWQRLGIVLSLAWIVVILTFVAIDFHTMHAEREQNLSMNQPPKGFVIEPKAKTTFFKWLPVDSLTKDVPVRDFSLRIDKFILILFCPLIIGWLVIYLFIIIIKWIKKGFLRNKKST